MERFVCASGIDNQQIPEALTTELGISVAEDLHLRADAIAAVSRKMHSGGWIRLPFCGTLCSEALGAKPVLSLSGSRVKEASYKKTEELPLEPDWNIPRLAAMLDAVEILSTEGHHVAYDLDGPFTTLCTLLPMSRVFSALRKPAGQILLQQAEDWISGYAAQVVRRGARLLSFADPVATPDILGERLFTTVYVPYLKRLLARLQAEHPEIPIHLCGKLTQSLLDTKNCQVKKWRCDHCQTYGQALSAYCEAGNGGMIGHYCLNLLDAGHPYLHIVNFE